ncbi:hypothetical protein Droror1_Dr00008250 [Drosera rotundifolia]
MTNLYAICPQYTLPPLPFKPRNNEKTLVWWPNALITNNPELWHPVSFSFLTSHSPLLLLLLLLFSGPASASAPSSCLCAPSSPSTLNSFSSIFVTVLASSKLPMKLSKSNGHEKEQGDECELEEFGSWFDLASLRYELRLSWYAKMGSLTPLNEVAEVKVSRALKKKFCISRDLIKFCSSAKNGLDCYLRLWDSSTRQLLSALPQEEQHQRRYQTLSALVFSGRFEFSSALRLRNWILIVAQVLALVQVLV